jgi:hypoxanthine phosphoribosyltransferase
MEQIQNVLENSDLLFDLVDIDRALTALSEEINLAYASLNPLLLVVMNGSVMTSGHLLPKLNFPLELDYIHATRYGDKTVGGEVDWCHQPLTDLKDRHILLVEDIFDEGVTLDVLRTYCERAGAASVKCVCLLDKDHVNKQGTLPEYIGLQVPNRYVFGFGMDYKGYWRNAPGIYAVKDL